MYHFSCFCFVYQCYCSYWRIRSDLSCLSCLWHFSIIGFVMVCYHLLW